MPKRNRSYVHLHRYRGGTTPLEFKYRAHSGQRLFIVFLTQAPDGISFENAWGAPEGHAYVAKIKKNTVNCIQDAITQFVQLSNGNNEIEYYPIRGRTFVRLTFSETEEERASIIVANNRITREITEFTEKVSKSLFKVQTLNDIIEFVVFVLSLQKPSDIDALNRELFDLYEYVFREYAVDEERYNNMIIEGRIHSNIDTLVGSIPEPLAKSLLVMQATVYEYVRIKNNGITEDHKRTIDELFGRITCNAHAACAPSRHATKLPVRKS